MIVISCSLNHVKQIMGLSTFISIATQGICRLCVFLCDQDRVYGPCYLKMVFVFEFVSLRFPGRSLYFMLS